MKLRPSGPRPGPFPPAIPPSDARQAARAVPGWLPEGRERPPLASIRLHDVLYVARRAHLGKEGVTAPRQVNAIANMAFLDWPENAEIAAVSPQEYWLTMTASMEKERLERQLYWHALPVGWEQLDYATFLERRRNLIAAVVRDGFNTLWEDRKSSRTDIRQGSCNCRRVPDCRVQVYGTVESPCRSS